MRLRAAIRAGEDRPPLRSVSAVQPVLPEYLQGEVVNSGFIALARARYIQNFDRICIDEVFQPPNLLGKGIAPSFTVMNVQDRFVGMPGVS
jgi:hypothetical protein